MINDVKKLEIFADRIIPEHIKQNHPQFLFFVEKFFEFLEQENNSYDVVSSVLYNQDIDNSINVFLENYRKKYAPELPNQSKILLSEFIKNIRAIYRSKGTEQSFRAMMLALYGDQADVYYPRVDVLKTSDGKWYQPVVISVEMLDGSTITDYQWLYDNFFGKEIVGLTSADSGFVDKIVYAPDPSVDASTTDPPQVFALEIENSNKKWVYGEDLLVKNAGNLEAAKIKIMTPLYDSATESYVGNESIVIEDGRFLNSDGFLSSEKRLQDNYYYHSQSYQIRSPVPPTVYSKVFQNLLHPVGMISFYVIDYLDGQHVVTGDKAKSYYEMIIEWFSIALAKAYTKDTQYGINWLTLSYMGNTPHTYAWIEANRWRLPWVNIFHVGYFDNIPVSDFQTKAAEPWPYGFPTDTIVV